MTKLVECIPNFSEGRRAEVVDAIAAAIAAVPGVHLLDRHSDHDHNRSVLTFACPLDQAVPAAFAGIARAAELIDLEQHRGEHPRLGATDVVPFVPLGETTMEECITLAGELGRRVGEELGIPVYLYEAAAQRPDRTNLEDIRRGEYEGLKQAIGSDPDRRPDFGPMTLGPAGATVIGARKPLIAYNVYLTTGDVEVAKQIARAVRQSSGGLRHVKALGLLVEGRAQVSMNLTDHTQTPIHRAVELIRREAARYGVAVHHAELVGLAPQSALIEAARWYLQLDGLQSEQILENQLYAAAISAPSLTERLAAATPTPGGGSAAAYAGAMAAALVGMVARLTLGKRDYTPVQERMAAVAERADQLRAALESAVEADARAFEGVMQALRLPKATDQEKQARAAQFERATGQAAAVPLAVCRLAAETLELAAEVAEDGNRNAASDAGSAGALAQAALSAAALNVTANAASLKNPASGQPWLDEARQWRGRGEAASKRLNAALAERASLTA
jgi:glutamate formiminotransferase/formiminotetrahydrofolate cyclodeaminase